MNREVHVRFCEGLGCNSLGLLTYGRSQVTHSQRHHRAALTNLEFAPPGTRIMARPRGRRRQLHLALLDAQPRGCNAAVAG